MRLARLTAAAALVVLVVGVVVALASSAPRLAGTNDLRAGLGIVVPAGEELCQGPAFVPGDAARARFVVDESAALAMEVRDGGRTLARGRGGVVIALSPHTEPRVVDEVCIRNRGEQPVSLGGQALPPEQAARVGGEPVGGRARIEWLRAGTESWYELAPTVVHRFGLGKPSWLGSWTVVLAAALVLASWLAAMRLLKGRWR